MSGPRDLKESPSQTAGPYVHIGCLPNFAGIGGVYPGDIGAQMAGAGAKGRRITIAGAVWDGFGAPLKDAMVEIWQADAAGLHPGADAGADPDFTGFGRRGADMETGEWSFETVKPGPVAFVDGRMQAPHVSFWIVARGINIGLHTRMYFPDEDAANAADPVLSRIEHRARVATLIAAQDGPDAYRFDIRLQGADETIFFDS